MTSRTRWIAVFAAVALWLPATAPADEMEATGPDLPTAATAPPTAAGQPTASIEGGWSGDGGKQAIEDWHARNPWGFGSDYVYPLTRGLTRSAVPLWGKIPVYPLAVVFDTLQLPFGAIGGLWGN